MSRFSENTPRFGDAPGKLRDIVHIYGDVKTKPLVHLLYTNKNVKFF
jgi:hypothetical protein